MSIGLNLRNTASLASYLREISDPHSPLYRHYLNPASFAALYGPLPQSEAAVSAYFRSLAVWASSGTIVAERPMYFNYHNITQGGTEVVGYTG